MEWFGDIHDRDSREGREGADEAWQGQPTPPWFSVDWQMAQPDCPTSLELIKQLFRRGQIPLTIRILVLAGMEVVTFFLMF